MIGFYSPCPHCLPSPEPLQLEPAAWPKYTSGFYRDLPSVTFFVSPPNCFWLLSKHGSRRNVGGGTKNLCDGARLNTLLWGVYCCCCSVCCQDYTKHRPDDRCVFFRDAVGFPRPGKLLQTERRAGITSLVINRNCSP